MYKLGLIGSPLDHSLSPRIHKAALESCGLEGEYALFPVAPGDDQGLQRLLEGLRTGELAGLNITIPHKQTVIPFLDALTPTARAIGAVNTIYLKDGQLTGDNTDAPGFLVDLKKFLTAKGRRNEGIKRVLILGAGGSARAVVYALARDGWAVTIAARRLEQATNLVNQLPMTDSQASTITYHPTNLYSLFSNLSLLINTTPLGMSPDSETSPWPADLPLPPNAAVYDLVYNPRETRLVQQARAVGLPAITGLGMLIEQAALSFETWTGCAPPRSALITAIHSTNY